MAQVAQLSKSLDLSKPHPALASGVSASYQRYRSANSSYQEGDTVSIAIPTGGAKNTFLLPSESYLELQMTASVADLSGSSVFLEGNAYSLFSSVRIFHGSNLLYECNNAARLFRALADHAGLDSKTSNEILIGTNQAYPWDGRALANNGVYKFAIALPVPLLGSLTDAAVPLGFMGASDLRLEIGLVPTANMCMTTSVDTGATEAATGTNVTANPTLGFTISECYYNAKVSHLSSDLNAALISSFGDRPIAFPSVGWSTEQSHVPAGTASHSMKLNSNYSSLKSVMWYCINQAISLGQPLDFNIGRANSRFAGGKLSAFWLDMGGESIPSHRHIAVSANGATLPKTTLEADFHASVPMAGLMRCFNQIGVGAARVAYTRTMYTCSLSTAAGQRACIGAFLAGIDLERADGDGSDIIFQGANTRNQSMDMHVEWSTGTDSAQTMFCFSNYDVMYTLVNGSLVKSD